MMHARAAVLVPWAWILDGREQFNALGNLVDRGRGEVESMRAVFFDEHNFKLE